MDQRPFIDAIDLLASRMSRHDLEALLDVFFTPNLMPFIYRRIGQALERAFSNPVLDAEPGRSVDVSTEFYHETGDRLAALANAPRTKFQEECLKTKEFHENHPKLWSLYLRIPLLGAGKQSELENRIKTAYCFETQRSMAARLAELLHSVPYRRGLVEKQHLCTEEHACDVAEVEFIPPVPSFDERSLS